VAKLVAAHAMVVASDRNQCKICHCTINCNCLLGLKQRKNHYQLVPNPSTICRSTTPSDDKCEERSNSSDDGGHANDMEIDNFEHPDIDGQDVWMAACVDNDGEASDGNIEEYDTGQEAGDGFWEESDEGGLDLHYFDDLDELLSLEEMEEELEDLIGPAHDLEVWNLHKLRFRHNIPHIKFL
jgi:hypothetical protein